MEGENGRPVFYEPNGIDTDRFPVQSSVSPDFPLITVGRLIESKRTGLLISRSRGFSGSARERNSG